MIRHRTGTARSGPPPDRPPTPAPPPPPAWRNWLLIAGLVLTVALFLLPSPTAPKVEQLSYSQLKSDIAADHVRSVEIGSDGHIQGKLKDGTRFTSSYPTNLQDPEFTKLLDDHNVQVTTQAARTSIWSVLLSLLPLAIIVGLFVWSGRAASSSTTGAANDLVGATDLATRMVREFGMSSALGPVGFASGSPLYLGGEQVRSRPYAEATQRLIDEEVATLLRQAEQRATGVLRDHRDALDRLTEVLLERETIDGTDVDEILGRVPGRRQPVGATGHTATMPAGGEDWRHVAADGQRR